MASNKISGKRMLAFKIVFLCVFVFSLLVGVYLTNLVNGISEESDAKVNYIEKWTVTDRQGKSFVVGRKYSDRRMYDEDFVIVSTLPDSIGNDCELCFMNRSDVDVFIGGELREDFKRGRDTKIPGGSLKEFYMTVPLNSADSGAELKMVRHSTDWNPEVVTETFVTTHQGLFNYLFDKYGLAFCFEIVLFISALLVTMISLFMRIAARQSLDMLYGALGILDIACWLLSVSQLTPFFTRIYYVDGLMRFLFCMMIPFAMLIYIDSIQQHRYRLHYAALFMLSLLSYVLFTILHFTGVQSFQNSLVYIDSVLGLVGFCSLVTIALDVRNGHIKEYIYTAVGLLLFVLSSFVEIIILIFLEPESSGIPIMIGMMSMLVLVVIQQVDDLRKMKTHLETEVTTKTEENEKLLIHIVQTLAGTIDAKDKYTNGHSSRVAEYSREIARRYGYDEAKLNDIYMMGLLHDIGKIGIPDTVINKPGRLSDEEFEMIKKHPVMGAKILSNIEEKKELAVGAMWHHEKYGGGGYPDGIKGDEIPEAARIIAVADAYDAMTSYRSYRNPMTQKRVRKEIENGKGTQFDPTFASIMLEMISEDVYYILREKKA